MIAYADIDAFFAAMDASPDPIRFAAAFVGVLSATVSPEIWDAALARTATRLAEQATS